MYVKMQTPYKYNFYLNPNEAMNPQYSQIDPINMFKLSRAIIQFI